MNAKTSHQVDRVIHGGTIVGETHSYDASVAIDGDKIVAVGDDNAMPSARERVDATGMHLLPGAIDVHVHFRDPGYSYKETWETGTAAAAMGGTTTVFEMPNTKPATDNPEAVADKLARADSAAYVDYGVYGLLGEHNIDALESLADAGVIGYKCFMGNTFGNLPAPSTGAMLEAFERISPLGLRISLHAETASIMAWRYEKLRAAGKNNLRAHVAARPAVVACEAVSRAAVLAEWTGARIHVLHVSSADELRPLADAKARGVDITAETCPHYLYLDESDYDRLGGVMRVNPPIRNHVDQLALWAGLADRTLDMLATDHAPHLPEEKNQDSIWDTDCGFPGVETQMPLMLDAVGKGRLSLNEYVRLSAGAPARAWGLYPRKGLIAPDAQADIAMIDTRQTMTIDQSALHSVNARVSPFHGTAVIGLPMHTLVGGVFVMRDRELISDARGHGQNVKSFQRMPTPNIQHADQTLSTHLG